VNVLNYLNDQKKRFFTIIGHSVGGAVAIHTVDHILNSKINLEIASMIVIDIVEGTALESLEYTKKVLEKRPKEFQSIERAIQWSLESQFLSNVESSRVRFSNVNKDFNSRTISEKY
jgi:protein phosphatase methylesterase 1